MHLYILSPKSLLGFHTEDQKGQRKKNLFVLPVNGGKK